MLTPYYKKNGKLVSFLSISKILKKRIERGENIDPTEVVLLKSKSMADEGNFFEYYLDKETASKYKINNDDIISEELILFDDMFLNFMDDMDYIETEKYYASLK